MLLTMNLQLFAHKKGGGSTSNYRDSESKRLGAKSADTKQLQVVQFYTVNAELKFIQV